MKKIFLFFLIAIFLFGLFSFVSAEDENAKDESGRKLEVQYPTILDVTPKTVEGTQLPDYVKYIFNFAIIIAGVIAFGVIVYGGIRWLTSTGDPVKLSDAKDQIFAAFLGLVILLSSWLILTTINPQLVIIEPTKLEGVTTKAPSGVWLCKKSVDIENDKERAEECLRLDASRNIDDVNSKFNNKIKNVYLVNDGGTEYGVILFEDEGFKDNCQIFESNGVVDISKPSSAIPFLKKASQGTVTLYENTDYNEGAEGEKWGPYVVGRYNGLKAEPCGSMKIEGGPLIVALGKGNFNGGCEVFHESRRSLIEHEVGKFCWGLCQDKKGIFCYKPCVKTMQIVGGAIY